MSFANSVDPGTVRQVAVPNWATAKKMSMGLSTTSMLDDVATLARWLNWLTRDGVRDAQVANSMSLQSGKPPAIFLRN